MRSQFLALLAALAPFAIADVKFISPAAGASLAPGTYTVTWEDSGASPPLSSLTLTALQLLVGGNIPGTNTNPIYSYSGTLVGTTSATVTITAGIAESITNGFYWQMTSTTSTGTLYNFSPRFSLTGMTGSVGAEFLTAANAISGTAGPATTDQLAGQPAAGDVASSAAPEGGEFAVPYYLQTGLTKYAPMQPIPPTKITAQSATPLNPTSAFTIATTWMPIATILTTITESQTSTVQTLENTIAAQAGPTGDMAKFLARWKD